MGTTSGQLLGVLLLALTAGAAGAAEVSVKAAMSPKEQIRLDFTDGSKHFVLMVRREGTAQGTGPFAGAKVTEYGWHDLVPGESGDPRGYLVFAAPNGDLAYVKWRVRAVFVPGADGKPKLLDNGYWEIAGGTGRFQGLKGAGTLHIKAVSPTDREFSLEGEVGGGG
ncbi:MAG: hypothetical protein ACOZDY_17635 [Pseudomonadota bacterium]